MSAPDRIRFLAFSLLFFLFGITLTSGFSLWQPAAVKTIPASGLIEADVYEVSAEPLVLSQSHVSAQPVLAVRQTKLQPVGVVTEVFVLAGDKVEKGDMLLKLDETAGRLQLEQAKAKVKLLEASINLIDSKLEDVQDGLSNINDSIDQLESQIRQVKSARTQYESLTSQLAQAQAELARAQATGDSARIAHTQATLDVVTRALVQLQASLAAINGQATAQGGAVDLNSLIAQMEKGLRKMRSAKSALYAAETALFVQEAALPYQLKAAQIGVGIAEKQMAKTEIKAPASGWVLIKRIHPGEQTFPGASLMTIVDLREVNLKLFIPLSEMRKVKVGQITQVTIDSYPDKSFEGKVSRIASRVEFMPSNLLSGELSATQVVEVTVAIENPDLILRPGMPADAEIVASR